MSEHETELFRVIKITNDKVLQAVRKLCCTLDGQQKKRELPPKVAVHDDIRDELAEIQDGLPIRGDRLLVPETLRNPCFTHYTPIIEE